MTYTTVESRRAIPAANSVNLSPESKNYSNPNITVDLFDAYLDSRHSSYIYLSLATIVTIESLKRLHTNSETELNSSTNNVEFYVDKRSNNEPFQVNNYKLIYQRR